MISKDLSEIVRQGRRYRTDALAPYGLTYYHGVFLPAIAENPGLSQDQLAQILCLNKSNVARRVASLEEEGLVERTPNTRDKRITQLTLTDKAMQLLPMIRTALREWDDYLTQGITEEERALLERLLAGIKERAVSWKEEAHV